MAEPRKRYRVQITRTYWASGTVDDVGASSAKAASKKALTMPYEIDSSLDGSEEDEVTEVELSSWRCRCGAWNPAFVNRCAANCDRARPKSLME